MWIPRIPIIAPQSRISNAQLPSSILNVRIMGIHKLKVTFSYGLEFWILALKRVLAMHRDKIPYHVINSQPAKFLVTRAYNQTGQKEAKFHWIILNNWIGLCYVLKLGYSVCKKLFIKIFSLIPSLKNNSCFPACCMGLLGKQTLHIEWKKQQWQLSWVL